MPRAFANNRVSGSEPLSLQGSRDNFPGKSTPRHLSRELSLLSFFAHTRPRRLLQPPPLIRFLRRRLNERGAFQKRGIDIGSLFSSYFSFFFFFFLNKLGQSKNKLSLIVDPSKTRPRYFASFPPLSLFFFPGQLLNTQSESYIRCPMLFKRTRFKSWPSILHYWRQKLSKRRGSSFLGTGKKSRGIRGREMGK